jgi:hypothetical protein
MTTIQIEKAFLIRIYNKLFDMGKGLQHLLPVTELPALKKLDPSVDSMLTTCTQINAYLMKYKSLIDPKLSYNSSELLEIFGDIAYAIQHNDNKMLVDCACHFDQFYDMNVKAIA